MIVCHCRKITDRDLQSCIDAGATTEMEIQRTCGAGGVCGGCRDAVQEVLAERVPGTGLVFIRLAETG